MVDTGPIQVVMAVLYGYRLHQLWTAAIAFQLHICIHVENNIKYTGHTYIAIIYIGIYADVDITQDNCNATRMIYCLHELQDATISMTTY